MEKTRDTTHPGSKAGSMTSDRPDLKGGARMNATTHRASLSAGTEARRPRATRLDWAVGVTSGWLVGGFWLDGWAHHAVPQLETFFTPWHAALYSGFLALATVLVGAWAGGPLRAAWRRPDAAGGARAALLPALLSSTFVLSLLTFFTHYANPFGLPRAAADQPAVAEQLGQIVGVLGILLHAALVTG